MIFVIFIRKSSRYSNYRLLSRIHLERSIPVLLCHLECNIPLIFSRGPSIGQFEGHGTAWIQTTTFVVFAPATINADFCSYHYMTLHWFRIITFKIRVYDTISFIVCSFCISNISWWYARWNPLLGNNAHLEVLTGSNVMFGRRCL